MSKFSIWVNAMRPRTLPLSISGIVTGSAIAYRYDLFSWNIFIPAILTTVLLQILSNLANDYGDAQKGSDGQDRIGPQRMVQSGLLSINEIKKGIVILVVLSLITGIYLLIQAFPNKEFFKFFIFLALGLLAIWAAIKYTVGKSAYGYRGFGDLFVILFFGFVSVLGSCYLFTSHINALAIFQSLVIGLLSTGVLHLNNMRDRQSDTRSGKITLAVKLGFGRSKLYFYALIIIAMMMSLISAWFYSLHLTDYLFSISLIPLVILLIQVAKVNEERDFNKFLKPLALNTFLYATLFFIGFII